jgi:hypothetical protein
MFSGMNPTLTDFPTPGVPARHNAPTPLLAVLLTGASVLADPGWKKEVVAIAPAGCTRRGF